MRVRRRNSNRADFTEAFAQPLGVPPPPLGPFLQLDQLPPSDGGLKFGHAHIGAEGLMQPAKSRRVIAAMGRVMALSMILERPGARPKGFILGHQQAAFAAGGDDLVLAKGKWAEEPECSTRAILIAGAVRLSTILDARNIL